MGYYELKWKEAAQKESEYQTIINQLDAQNKIVAIASGKTLLAAGRFKDSNLRGDYYDIYSGKVDTWVIYAQSIKTRFVTMKGEIDDKIAKATAQRNLWGSRKSEQIWVEDSQWIK